MNAPRSKINKHLASFKGKHDGMTGVIICTGPTMFDYVQKDRAIHFGVNEAALSHFELDYLFIQDCKPAHIFGYELNGSYYDKAKCVKFAGITPRISTVKNIPADRREKHNWIDYEVGYEGQCEFVDDIASYCLGDGNSVSFSAAQFALYSGVSKIYLVGVDIDCPDTAYERQPHGADIYNQFNHKKKWAKFKEFAEEKYPHVKIVSINPIGLKGLFDDYYSNDSGQNRQQKD